VRTHLATGRRTLLDKTWEFVALHKDRSIFPIRLTVHLISGLGEDSVVGGGVACSEGMIWGHGDQGCGEQML
jgi:hypothetical protein